MAEGCSRQRRAQPGEVGGVALAGVGGQLELLGARREISVEGVHDGGGRLEGARGQPAPHRLWDGAPTFLPPLIGGTCTNSAFKLRVKCAKCAPQICRKYAIFPVAGDFWPCSDPPPCKPLMTLWDIYLTFTNLGPTKHIIAIP